MIAVSGSCRMVQASKVRESAQGRSQESSAGKDDSQSSREYPGTALRRQGRVHTFNRDSKRSVLGSSGRLYIIGDLRHPCNESIALARNCPDQFRLVRIVPQNLSQAV